MPENKGENAGPTEDDSRGRAAEHARRKEYTCPRCAAAAGVRIHVRLAEKIGVSAILVRKKTGL
jgi:hypothetical protein